MSPRREGKKEPTGSVREKYPKKGPKKQDVVHFTSDFHFTQIRYNFYTAIFFKLGKLGSEISSPSYILVTAYGPTIFGSAYSEQ